MSLIEMPNYGIVAQFAETPNTANTKDDFLLKAHLPVTAVQPR